MCRSQRFALVSVGERRKSGAGPIPGASIANPPATMAAHTDSTRFLYPARDRRSPGMASGIPEGLPVWAAVASRAGACTAILCVWRLGGDPGVALDMPGRRDERGSGAGDGAGDPTGGIARQLTVRRSLGNLCREVNARANANREDAALYRSFVLSE